MNIPSLWPMLALALAIGLYAQSQQLHQAQAQTAQLEQQQQLAWVQTKNLEAQYRHDAQQKDKDTKAAIAVAHADADRARAASIGLRRDMASYLEAHRHRAAVATVAGQCAPDEAASVVFTQLFQWIDDAAGELAAAVDESRARGIGCEAIYDAALKTGQ